MSGPSKPMNVGRSSSNTSQDFLAADSSGSIPSRPQFSSRNRIPSSQSLRGRGKPTPPATPPVSNIPPRSGTPGSYRPAGITSDSFEGQPRSFKSAAAVPADLDLDNVPEEEKTRVLRRHLVSREERQIQVDQRSPSDSDSEGENDAGSSIGKDDTSGRISESANTKPIKDLSESDVFPVPYEMPGGDIT